MCTEKTITIRNQSVKLIVWDTAGQEEYSSIASMYYRGAQGAVMVYDLTVRETFARVDFWLKQLKSFVPDAVIYVVGNKIDQESNRDIPNDEIEAYCKENGLKHLETSAKEDIGQKELFKSIVTDIVDKNPIKGGSKFSDTSNRKHITVNENDNVKISHRNNTAKKNEKHKKGDKCC